MKNLFKRFASLDNKKKVGYLLVASVFFLLSLGQLQRFEFSFGTIYLHDLALCISCLWLSIFSAHTVNLCTILKKYSLPLFLISFISIRTLIAAIFTDDLNAFFYIIRLWVYGYFLILISQNFTKRNIFLLTITSLSIILYLSLLQYTFLPDTRFLFILGWDDHYYRMIGTLFDPAFTGLVLLFVVLALLYTTLLSRQLQIFLTTFASIGIALTFSRATYLAFGLTLGFVFIWNWLKAKQAYMYVLVACCLVIFGLTLLLSPKPGGEGVNLLRTSTIEARASALKSHTDTFSLNTLIFGNGLFVRDQVIKYSIPYHPRTPDDFITALLIAGGIPVFLLFCIILYYEMRNKLTYNVLNVALTISLLVHSLFNASYVQPFVVLYFWSLYLSTEKYKI